MKMFIKLEVYSSNINDYTTCNFYPHRHFSYHRRPSFPKQQNQRRKTKEKNNEKSRGLVILAYVQRVTEPVQRIIKDQDIYSISCQNTQKSQTNSASKI